MNLISFRLTFRELRDRYALLVGSMKFQNIGRWGHLKRFVTFLIKYEIRCFSALKADAIEVIKQQEGVVKENDRNSTQLARVKSHGNNQHLPANFVSSMSSFG